MNFELINEMRFKRKNVIMKNVRNKNFDSFLLLFIILNGTRINKHYILELIDILFYFTTVFFLT